MADDDEHITYGYVLQVRRHAYGMRYLGTLCLLIAKMNRM